jgi:HsdM N-terminal domain
MAKKKSTGANLGFEEKLWAAADKLRGHIDAAEYKHVVLGLVFLKYISDAFQAFRRRRPGRIPSRKRFLGSAGCSLELRPATRKVRIRRSGNEEKTGHWSTC